MKTPEMFQQFENSRGFTLFQLVGVLVAIAIVATLALQVVSSMDARARIQEALAEMQEIKYAIAGDPAIDLECGYVGDVGALPGTLADLISQPADVCDSWNGPYIEIGSSEAPDDWKTDPWGNEYSYDQGSLTLTSTGGDTVLTVPIAGSYTDLLGNSMTLRQQYQDGLELFVESGCDLREFSYLGGDQWRADGLTRCPGDVLMVFEGDTTYRTPDGDAPEDLAYGIIQYVGGSAAVGGSDNQRVSYAIRNTGDPAMQVTAVTISWEESGRCWGNLTPYLERLTIGGQDVWDTQSNGGKRTASSGRLELNPSLELASGQTTVDLMEFKSTASGGGLNVDMRGTDFTMVFYTENAGKQVVNFRTPGSCLPGAVEYVDGSLVAEPGASGDNGGGEQEQYQDGDGNCVDVDGDGKIAICHVPPGNPDNAHTIVISVNAWPAHKAHGDECGPCGGGGHGYGGGGQGQGHGHGHGHGNGGSGDDGIIYDLEFDLRNPGQSPVYIHQIVPAWNAPGYLERFVINGVSLWDDAENRLSGGTTITLDSPLILQPGLIRDNEMEEFHQQQSGGEHANMAGTAMDITFIDAGGREYPVSFQVDELNQDGDDNKDEGELCQKQMNYVVEYKHGGRSVKYEDAEPGLGEDGAEETDTFVMEVGNAGNSVSVDIKSAWYSDTIELEGVGDIQTSSTGFRAELVDISDGEYTVDISSAGNQHAMSHVTFHYDYGAVVVSPGEGEQIRVQRQYRCRAGNGRDDERGGKGKGKGKGKGHG